MTSNIDFGAQFQTKEKPNEFSKISMLANNETKTLPTAIRRWRIDECFAEMLVQ